MVNDFSWVGISWFIFLLWGLTIAILFEKNKELKKLRKRRAKTVLGSRQDNKSPSNLKNNRFK